MVLRDNLNVTTECDYINFNRVANQRYSNRKVVFFFVFGSYSLLYVYLMHIIIYYHYFILQKKEAHKGSFSNNIRKTSQESNESYGSKFKVICSENIYNV